MAIKVPLLPEHYRAASFNHGELYYVLTDRAKSIVEYKHPKTGILQDHYSLVYHNGGMSLTTYSDSLARGVINKLLKWPVYAVVSDHINDVNEYLCSQDFEDQYVATKGFPRRNKPNTIVSFENSTDAAYMMLSYQKKLYIVSVSSSTDRASPSS